MRTLGLAIELSDGFAASQYTNYDFDSLVEIDGKVVAVGEDGIFTLEGQTDDGTNIDAFVELPITDLGSSLLKRLRKVLVGYEAEDAIKATLVYDEDANKTGTYLLPPRKKGQTEHSSGVTIQRSNGSGRFFQLKIANTNGCDFSIDTLEAEIYYLPRRIRTR